MKTLQSKRASVHSMLRKVLTGLILAGALTFGTFGTVDSANAQGAPLCDRFGPSPPASGLSGWAACPAAPNIVVTTTTVGSVGGPTDYHLHLRDTAGASAACSTDEKYLGDWVKKTGGCGQFCFDFKVFVSGVPPGPITPSFIIWSGTNRATFVANFTVTSNDPWRQNICVPIALGATPPSGPQGHWVVNTGTWNSIITNVTMVQLPVDFTASPSEEVGYDNICMNPKPCDNAALRLCKVAGPGVAVGTPFTFTAGTNTVTVPAGTPVAGTCVNVVDPSLTVGSNVAVIETIPANTTVSNIAVTPPAAMTGPPNLATGNVGVTLGTGVTEVTFTDTARPPPPPEINGCLKDAKVAVKCNPNGTYTLTLSGVGFTATDITLTSQTAGVAITPPQQAWAATTTWTITGATPGQTVILSANATNTGHGGEPGTDQCCSGEIKIVMPDCPKPQVGEVIVEKKVKNNTSAPASAINSLVFPAGLACTTPSNLNVSFGLNNGGSHTENNVPYTSICTVTESTSTLPPVPKDACGQGTTAVWATPVITPPSATINAPVTVLTVVNELDCVKTGSLVVEKKVKYDGPITLPSQIYPVTVTCGSIVTNLNLVNGAPQTISNIPLNTSCSVVEGTVPTPPNICRPPLTPVWSTTYVPPSPVIVTAATTTVEIVNTLVCRQVRTCPPPFVLGPADQCVCPPGTVQRGRECVKQETCPPPKVPGPVAGQCICPPGSHPVGNTCEGPPPPACKPPMIPGPVAGQCICPPGTVQRGRECVKQPACQPPMVAGPIPGQCICPQGMVQQGRRCIPRVICRPPQIPNAAGTACACPPGTVQRGRTCEQPKVCNPPARLNRLGQCACPPDMVARGNSCIARERPSPGIIINPRGGRNTPFGPRGPGQGESPGGPRGQGQGESPGRR